MVKGNYHILPQDPALGNKKLFNNKTDRFKEEKLSPDNIADGLKT